jgi:hypothetical protein
LANVDFSKRGSSLAEAFDSGISIFFLLDKAAFKNNYIYLRRILKEGGSPQTRNLFLSIPDEKRKRRKGTLKKLWISLTAAAVLLFTRRIMLAKAADVIRLGSIHPLTGAVVHEWVGTDLLTNDMIRKAYLGM